MLEGQGEPAQGDDGDGCGGGDDGGDIALRVKGKRLTRRGAGGCHTWWQYV